MSAYIEQPEHFGVLAAYAVKNDAVIYEWRVADKQIETAQRVARELARENIRSVAYRYPDDKDGHRPGPANLTDAQIEEAAAIWAAHYVQNYSKVKPLLKPVNVLSICQGYSYQSCETEDWQTTQAWLQIERTKDAAISQLQGYRDAPWSWQDENEPYGLTTLYEEAA